MRYHVEEVISRAKRCSSTCDGETVSDPFNEDEPGVDRVLDGGLALIAGFVHVRRRCLKCGVEHMLRERATYELLNQAKPSAVCRRAR